MMKTTVRAVRVPRHMLQSGITAVARGLQKRERAEGGEGSVLGGSSRGASVCLVRERRMRISQEILILF
jgi:hypothetical protein